MNLSNIIGVLLWANYNYIRKSPHIIRSVNCCHFLESYTIKLLLRLELFLFHSLIERQNVFILVD